MTQIDPEKRKTTPHVFPKGRFWIAGFVCIVRFRQIVSLAARLKRKLLGFQLEPGPVAAPRTIPRVIWLYWDKGEAEAPQLVKACIQSWRKLNPTWSVCVLSAADVPSTTGLPAKMLEELAPQAFSDLLRLRLLREKGGVWADATLYCVKPLDHWLPLVAQKGFFAFSWTDADFWMIWPDVRRRLASWFLASEAEGTVITAWEAHAQAYFEGRRIPHIYYWVHILLDWLYFRHGPFRQALDATPQLGAFAPHLVHNCVTRNGDDDAVKALLRAGVAPVQKLRWNYDEATVGRALAMLRGSESL